MKILESKYIFYALLSAIIIFLCFLQWNSNKKIEGLNLDVINLKNANAGIIESFEEWYTLDMRLDNSSLEEEVLLTDTSGIQSQFSHLLNEKPKVVFSYSVRHCDVCYKETIGQLKNAAELIGYENIILIGSYEKKREAFVFLRDQNIQFPFYFNNFYDLFDMQVNYPVLFVLDNNLDVKYPFVPHKEFPTLEKKYFREVLWRYYHITEEDFNQVFL